MNSHKQLGVLQVYILENRKKIYLLYYKMQRQIAPNDSI